VWTDPVNTDQASPPRRLWLAVLLGLGIAPLAASQGVPEGQGTPNFLVIVADDLGVDRVGAYGEHPNPGRTPNLDRLANAGVLFRSAYANPLCTPTRATLLTGRYSYRTGMGSNATLPELGGATSQAEDSISMVPYLQNPAQPSIRNWAYSERFAGQEQQQAIRGPRYELIRFTTPQLVTTEFYELQVVPFEQTNLVTIGLHPAQRHAYLQLVMLLP
jgi:hypothetical protein